MTGLFFCLASAEGAGLLFCPVAIQPHTIRLQRVLFRKCNYTAHAIKQHAELYRRFSRNLYRSAAADTRPAQAVKIPPVSRWSVSQRRSTSSAYQIPPPCRDAAQVSTVAYYNKVYKRVHGCALLWIHARRCSIAQTIQARRGGLLASAAPGAPAEGLASPPVQGQPGGLQSGTGQQSGAHRLAPSTRRDSPAAGARRAARNH